MKNEQMKDESVNDVDVDNLEIQPLADDDLDSVVGGLCSVWCCSSAQIEAN